jgi:hypothetical protein
LRGQGVCSGQERDLLMEVVGLEMSVKLGVVCGMRCVCVVWPSGTQRFGSSGHWLGRMRETIR